MGTGPIGSQVGREGVPMDGDVRATALVLLQRMLVMEVIRPYRICVVLGRIGRIKSGARMRPKLSIYPPGPSYIRRAFYHLKRVGAMTVFKMEELTRKSVNPHFFLSAMAKAKPPILTVEK
jgi:hypothetical protein